jgi:alpha-amylase/alpha-mannosidase (GH57 family)
LLDLLGRLVADGWVELLASGLYEPVLAAIARTDRAEQIGWMRERLAHRFGVEAHGLWLTERVWEPSLTADLADAGIRYALVDDRHFLVSGFEADQLHTPYVTEHDGKRITLLPIDERLRYLIPFRAPLHTRRYLRALSDSGHGLAVLVDDGEKFGGWPGTRRWIYRRGWLDRFLRMMSGLVERGAVTRHRIGCRGPGGERGNRLPADRLVPRDGELGPSDPGRRAAPLPGGGAGRGSDGRSRGRAAPGRALAAVPGQVS